MKLHYKTHPWPHQVRALKFLLRNGDGGGLQVPMRWGKSWVGINYAAALYLKEEVTRVLVVTVTSALGVWEDQVALHCPVPWRVLDWHGELLGQSEDYAESGGITFLVVNYPNVYTRARWGEGASWIPIHNEVIKKFKPQIIISDESHHMGKPTAVTSKMIYSYAQTAPWRVFMTGTMFHRKPFYVFGQVRFYDGGKTFGTAWTHFKKRIAVFGGYGNYEVLRYQNLAWMMNKVRQFTYIEKTVPKRPTVINELTYRLDGKHLEAYDEMATSKVLEVNGEVLTSEIALTLHLRLLMIAGGFVKLPSGKYKQVGDCTLRMCEDRLNEYMEQEIFKAVVACRFIPEVAAVAKLAKKIGFQPVLLHGGVPAGRERKRRIDFFNHTEKPALFISQIAAGKEGIDLSAADTVLWYSLTENYVEFDQFNARIEKFKDKRVLQRDFLLARGTQAQVAFEAMKIKQDVATFMVRNPKRVEAIAGKRPSRKR